MSGFEATSTSEFGGALALPAGKSITNFTVTMSSWACQSGNWTDGTCTTATGATFAQPITLNIYAANGTTPLGSVTQTFKHSVPAVIDCGLCGKVRRRHHRVVPARTGAQRKRLLSRRHVERHVQPVWRNGSD